VSSNGKNDPTGLNLTTRTTLKTLGFFDGGGLTADQLTAISSLVKGAKILQNIIVMNWGNTEIAESAFCGTGTGTAFGSLVQVIIHKAIDIKSSAFRECRALQSALFPVARALRSCLLQLH
jgi:hypothetical protein